MNTGSGFCGKTKACGIGQQDPFSAINEVAEAIERELDTGVYTLNSIPALNQQYSNTAVFLLENPIQRQIRLYGETDFYTAVASVNAYFERPEIIEIIQQYPRVQERIENSPISPIEVSAFIDQYQYIPASLIRQANILNTKLISELENFYGNNISSSVVGRFCALMPNIFAAIDTFFTALSDIQNFINDVRDFATNFQANLRNLIETIRNQVLETITRVVEDIRNIIENFTIENIISEIRTFAEDMIVRRFYELRSSILGFFSEFNIENIRERIRGIIDYASRVFQNPTLEDIQYLIYRFCNLASFIENTFNDLLNPLRIFRDNIQNSIDIIRGRSFFNTIGAIGAGGIRFPDEERDRRREDAPGPAPRGRTPPGPSGPPMQPTGAWRETITQEERDNVPTWAEIMTGEDSRLVFVEGHTPRTGAYRWDGPRVDLDSKVLLLRLQRRWGRRLEIISVFRTDEEQRNLWLDAAENRGLAENREEAIALFNSGASLEGVARPGSSPHNAGIAFDMFIDVSDQRAFIQLADETSFGGIGNYNWGIHVDTGSWRAWGGLRGYTRIPRT